MEPESQESELFHFVADSVNLMISYDLVKKRRKQKQ